MSDLTRRKTSIIWTAFKPIDSKFAICKICNKQLSYKSSITNLRKHLTMIHKTLVLRTDSNIKSDDSEQSAFDDNEIKMKCNLLENVIDLGEQISLPPSPTPSSSSNLPKYFITSENQQTNVEINEENRRITEKLLGLFILDFQPYSIVDGIGFRNLVATLNPTYALPDRKTISKILIPNEYEQCLNETKEIVKTFGSSFCISIDCWTSMNCVNYVAVNASFLDENFNLQSYLMDCFPVPSSQSSQKLAIKLRHLIINDWDIDESQIQLVVSGDIGNIRQAIETNLNCKRFECFINTINSIADDVLNLPDIKPLIDKIENIILYVNRTNNIKEEFIEYQKKISNSALNLKSSTKKWNSIFNMLECFIQLEEAVKHVFTLSDDLPNLDELEWQMARELCQILEPFESVMKSLGDESFCTASLVIPMLSVLKALYNELFQKDFSNYIQEAINFFKLEIDKRFNNTEELLSVETFLDPRFKNVAFFSTNQEELVKQNIINLIKPKLLYEHPIKVENTIAENYDNSGDCAEYEYKFSIWNAYDKMVANNCHRPATSRAILEVERYLEEGIIHRNEDPLKWWNEHKFIYPNLSVLARERLCNLASSTTCQNLFTKARVILNRKRTRFNDRKIKMLLFLNMNSRK